MRSYFVIHRLYDIMQCTNVCLYVTKAFVCVRYRMLTVDPHIAGSDRNDKLAGDLVTQWNSYGFDSVQTYNYTVLLTFPNKSSLNVLNIVSNNGSANVLFEANTTLEKPLAPGEDNPNVAPPYNAYSGIGTVNVSDIYVCYIVTRYIILLY